MAQVSGRARPGPATARPRLGGPPLFAAVTMLVLGVFHVLTGITALAQDRIPTTPSLTYTLPAPVWGWTQVVFGVLVALCGGALLQRRLIGRLAGIALAALSLFVNFLFLLLHPAWAIVIMTLDVLVIRALTVAWPEEPDRAADPLVAARDTATRPG
jgi:hypothetical protein